MDTNTLVGGLWLIGALCVSQPVYAQVDRDVGKVEPADRQLPQVIDNRSARVLLLFADTRSDLAEADKQQLRTFATYVIAYGLGALVEGFADDTGDDAFNEAMAADRATVVRRHLIELGVPTAKVKMLAFGRSRPARWDGTEESRAQNRRVQVRAVPEFERVN
jgi:outer membrane protein OmpA-like peptidoglycan-associated protein